jgi:hypothetical protein
LENCGTKEEHRGDDHDRRHHELADRDRHRPPPGLDLRPPRLDPRRRNLAAEAKERAHPPRLPARRPTLHAFAADLRQADHKAAIAWERYLREIEHAAASTIRRRLAALSFLWIDLHAGFLNYSFPRARNTLNLYGPIIAATFRF